MFGNLFGDIQRKQEEMMAKAAEITVEAEVGGIRVVANGRHEVVNISIEDPSVMQDKEQLEDTLLAAVNRALAEAGAQSAAEAQKLMEQMLPPGLGDMFKGAM